MTRQLTRAERTRSNFLAVLLLVGAGLAWTLGAGLANWWTGSGWAPAFLQLRPRGIGEAIRGIDGPGLVVLEHAPADRTAWIVWAAVVGVVWLLAVQYPLARLTRPRDPREDGLATWTDLLPLLSAPAVRRAGRFTRPDLTWWQRRLPFRRVPLTELGYRLGRLRGTRHELWANPEQRVRVIARTGWGKTARLLTPLVRALPGAALVGTTKNDLFEQTVRARQATGRPVWVLDFSDPEHRFAAGFPRLAWDPVTGCRDLTVALRRGRALVAGAEDGDRNDDQDKFFRDAAMHVAASWLHAADLSGQGMAAVLRWQRNIRLTEPHDVIELHPAAEPAARAALLKHLDERAARTTSGVERMLANALYPFGTRDGEEFAAGGGPALRELITSGATVYLLASPTTAAAVSPLLTMFADEWVHAVRSVALSLPGRRLPVPAVAVLDELRGLVPIPSLPQAAYEMRSYGLGLVYGIQNAHQEAELYGPQAETLAQNVQVTMVGGYDRSIAEELTDQAGQIAVPSVSVDGPLLAAEYGEGQQYRPTISAADQQKLRDGQSVVRVQGAPLFYATTPSFRDSRRLRRTITAEELSVRAEVTAAQAVTAAQRAMDWHRAQTLYTGPGSR